MTESAIPRRGEVLATAEKLFARRGFHATSVRDIAEALNIKGGSLYAHIESKDDLLWELVSAAAQRFLGALQPILQSDLVPVERLRQAIVAHVHVITSNLEAAAVFTNEWKCLGEQRKLEFAAQRDQYENTFRKMVTDCIRAGAFADVDEKFATLLILSSANWIYQWYRPDGPMTPEEIARKLTDLLLNGLRRASA